MGNFEVGISRSFDGIFEDDLCDGEYKQPKYAEEEDNTSEKWNSDDSDDDMSEDSDDNEDPEDSKGYRVNGEKLLMDFELRRGGLEVCTFGQVHGSEYLTCSYADLFMAITHPVPCKEVGYVKTTLSQMMLSKSEEEMLKEYGELVIDNYEVVEGGMEEGEFEKAAKVTLETESY